MEQKQLKSSFMENLIILATEDTTYHKRHDSSSFHDEPNAQLPFLNIFQVNTLDEYSKVHIINQHYIKYVLDFSLIAYNLQFLSLKEWILCLIYDNLLLMIILLLQIAILLTFLITHHPHHFTFEKKPFYLFLFKVQLLDLFYFQLLFLNHLDVHCYLYCSNGNNTSSFNFNSIYLLQILI